MSEQPFKFGPFDLFTERHLLLKSGKPLRPGSRAFDLLVALVSRAGQVVGKEELVAAAWPGVFVEGSSLPIHIAVLRKALSEDCSAPRIITNVPGRGYCFVALPTTQPPPDDPAPGLVVTATRRHLPRLGGRVIGRDALVAAIAEDVTRRPLVSLIGPGRIGKTTVALSIVALVAERFADGAVFVDLTAVRDDHMVQGALAAALGKAISSNDPGADLPAQLSGKHLLMDAVVITISAVEHWLWRVVDQNGTVLDVLAQSRRNTKAVKRLPRKLLARPCRAPRVMVTDKLASYGAAQRAVMPSVEHRKHKGLNKGAETSHQPTQRRERQMRRFTSAGQAQRFLSAHDGINNLFHLRHHRVPATRYRADRTRALQVWAEVASVTAAA